MSNLLEACLQCSALLNLPVKACPWRLQLHGRQISDLVVLSHDHIHDTIMMCEIP
jgi:hypothetical protein